MVLFTIRFSGSDKTPDFNILIPTSYLVIDTLWNSDMLIAKLLTHSWKRELNTMQMDGILLVRPGPTWFSTYHTWTTVLVWTLMILLRMLCFILLRHDLSTPLVLLRDTHNDLNMSVGLQGLCVSSSSTWVEEGVFWIRFPGRCISTAGGWYSLLSSTQQRGISGKSVGRGRFQCRGQSGDVIFRDVEDRWIHNIDDNVRRILCIGSMLDPRSKTQNTRVHWSYDRYELSIWVWTSVPLGA